MIYKLERGVIMDIVYEHRTYGYGRVSTKGQSEERQIESLIKYVPDARNIYIDKKSGKDFERVEYLAMKKEIRPGDTLYIHELDRLGRNKQLILDELKYYKEKRVIVKILNIPSTLTDYSSLKNDELQRSLMETMNNVIIEVMAIMAEQERINIVKRTREGIAVARQKGKRLGRPPVTLPDTWDADMQAWREGKVSAVSLYRDKYKISKTVFYKLVKECYINGKFNH